MYKLFEFGLVLRQVNVTKSFCLSIMNLDKFIRLPSFRDEESWDEFVESEQVIWTFLIKRWRLLG